MKRWLRAFWLGDESKPDDNKRPEITPQGIELIQSFEGCKLTPYHCAAGVGTIGYGSTYGVDGKRVNLSHPPISMAQANQLFYRDVAIFSDKVRGLIKVPVSGQQFSAIVSLAYNIGVGNLKASTLLRKLNRLDYEGCANEFPKWRKAGGRVLRGLVRRRKAERVLFLSG